jgi:hypothetical protein
MLFRWVMMLALAGTGLALAACAEMGEAMAASMAEQAAQIAATQAVTASTQAIDELETASTQMSTSPGTPIAVPSLPAIGKGMIVVDTPTVMIVQINGKRVIIVKPQHTDDDDDVR